MNTNLKVPSKYDKFRALIYRVLRRPYLVTAIAGYFFTFICVMVYMSKSPQYKSSVSLVMPGTGFSNNLNLAEIGQATSTTLTPFSGGGFSPRVNYKEILTGRGVVHNAATRLGYNSASFGKPQVLLTEQTSILEYSLTGGTPVEAKQKVTALYDAFQQELDRLRADESKRRDESIRHVIGDYQSTMIEARNKIVTFQQQAVLVASIQLEQLTLMQSQTQDKLLTAKAESSRLSHYVDQLSRDLGVSPALAGQAFALQSDAEFRGYLSELDTSASLLSQYTARWGDNHPKVKDTRLRFENARQQLINRSRNLLGIQSGDLIYNIDLQRVPDRAALFSDLVESYALLKGSESQINSMEKELELLNDKLRIYSREAAELQKLELEYKLAEAVYSTAVARLDASKADIFASYPVIQMLTPPSEPWEAVSPNKKIAFAAGFAGCLFITIGILTLWQRRYLINLLLKKS